MNRNTRGFTLQEKDLLTEGRLLKAETTEANHVDFDEPTLGVIIVGVFHFVANSQYGLFNDKGEIAAPEKLCEPVILRLKL